MKKINFKIKNHKISIKNNQGEKLVGLKTTPTAKKVKYPAIILVHGFGVTKEESGLFDNLAKHLAKAGFLVYRFDFSGCGESEGNYSKTSLTKLKSDLKTILKFVESESTVNTSKIGILAQSFGTATTISLEPRIAALVLTSSVAHPKEIFIEEYKKKGIYNPKGISQRSRSNGSTTKVKPQFWQDFNNHNLLKSIKKIHCPVLFIHGSKDEKIPVSEMLSYYKKANSPKEKIILKEAHHNLKPHRKKAYKIATSWFSKNI